MDEEYSEETINRFQDPEYTGEIENADAIGKAGNPTCGDVLKIFLEIEDDVIKKARFKTYGCIAAIASSDGLCEMLEGKTIEEAEEITGKEISSNLGELPPVKHHCSILGTEALKNALENYRKNREEK